MDMDTDGQEPAPEDTAVEQAPEAQVEDQPEATTGDDGADDTAHDESEGKKPPRGVQKRLDELTRLRHEAARDRDYWRDLAMRQNAPQQQAPAPAQGQPKEQDFEDYDQYQRALTRWEVRQEIETEKLQQQAIEKARTFEQRAEKAREKYPDFIEVVTDPSVTITPVMAEVIKDSEFGPDVAYYLGTNHSEAARIAALPLHRQAAELGRLEAKLSQPAKPAPRTPPPPPPKTVSGLSAGHTQDPGKMSMAEYVEARKAGKI